MKLKTLFILFFALVLFTRCGSESDKPTEATTTAETSGTEKVQTAETKQMVDELRGLITNGDPKVYFNWNHERAALYKTELETVAPKITTSFFTAIVLNYCSPAKTDNVLTNLKPTSINLKNLTRNHV